MEKEIIREKFRVKSSLIDYLIYDYQKKELEVRFKRGRYKGEVRSYGGVTKNELDSILTAESPGRRLLKVIAKKRGDDSGLWGYLLKKIKP